MDAFEAVSLPEPSAQVSQKYFTISKANRALVLVRRIVADIVADSHELRELKEAYQKHEAMGKSTLAEEKRQHYVRVFNHLAELREELEEIGCELKDYESGLVDFPALLDGRKVLLCWKLGEARIEHWHEVDAGFAGRRRIIEEPA